MQRKHFKKKNENIKYFIRCATRRHFSYYSEEYSPLVTYLLIRFLLIDFALPINPPPPTGCLHPYQLDKSRGFFAHTIQYSDKNVSLDIFVSEGTQLLFPDKLKRGVFYAKRNTIKVFKPVYVSASAAINYAH